MKIQKQTHPQLSRLAELVAPIDVAMLTTRSRNDELTSRPMTPLEMDETGQFWFFTARDSEVFDGRGPVSLAFVDPGKSVYVTVGGEAALVEDRERIRALWTPMARPWFPDGPDSPDLALLCVRPNSADTWEGPHSKVLRVLAMAASVAAARPIGLGDHDHVAPPTDTSDTGPLGPFPAAT